MLFANIGMWKNLFKSKKNSTSNTKVDSNLFHINFKLKHFPVTHVAQLCMCLCAYVTKMGNIRF